MFFCIVLTPISTTYGLWSTGNTRKYHQIDVYIYQCDVGWFQKRRDDTESFHAHFNEQFYDSHPNIFIFNELYRTVTTFKYLTYP